MRKCVGCRVNNPVSQNCTSRSVKMGGAWPVLCLYRVLTAPTRRRAARRLHSAVRLKNRSWSLSLGRVQTGTSLSWTCYAYTRIELCRCTAFPNPRDVGLQQYCLLTGTVAVLRGCVCWGEWPRFFFLFCLFHNSADYPLRVHVQQYNKI